MKTKKYRVEPGENISLEDFPTKVKTGYDSKSEAKKDLRKNIEVMRELQNKLYAHDKYSMLIVFQAMDAAGKDSTIKHVMSGLNPQGTEVYSFKAPSAKELDHGYLWRIFQCLPQRGRIGIFNRSHYEEVLVVKVHNLIKYQKLPKEFIGADIWKQRYEEIRNFEKYLVQNGTVILKFFLHISKDEQKERFLDRLNRPEKNWKFSSGDLKERSYWEDYQKVYAEAISATSTKHAPWYVIPNDRKWYGRLLVSKIITEKMESLNLKYPKLPEEEMEKLDEYRKLLEKEK